jgi:hypothetical protein
MVVLNAIAISINGAFVMFRRTALRRVVAFYLDEPLRLSKVSRRHSEAAILHEDAIRLIADDPHLSPETGEAIRNLLRNSPAAPLPDEIPSSDGQVQLPQENSRQ